MTHFHLCRRERLFGIAAVGRVGCVDAEPVFNSGYWEESESLLLLLESGSGSSTALKGDDKSPKFTSFGGATAPDTWMSHWSGHTKTLPQYEHRILLGGLWLSDAEWWKSRFCFWQGECREQTLREVLSMMGIGGFRKDWLSTIGIDGWWKDWARIV